MWHSAHATFYPSQSAHMRYAATVLVLGIVVAAASWVPFGLAIKRAFDAEMVVSDGPVTLDAERTLSVDVDPEQLARVAVRLDLSSTSIKRNDTSSSDPYDAMYSFPFRYRVTEPSGALVHEQSTFVAWDRGSRSYDRDDVSEQRGHVVVESSLQKFVPPASGRLRISYQLAADDVHDVTLNDARVLVYHRVRRHTGPVVTGIALVAGGFVLVAIGGIMLLVRAASSGESPRSVASDAALTEKRSRDIAMWCHLSSLAGFFVPFGGLIGPLVIWAVNKDDDDFLDRHGIAAINFRISIYIYSAVCLVLVFVLIGFVLLAALGLADLVLTVVAAVRASEGKEFRYPLSIPFIRARTRVSAI